MITILEGVVSGERWEKLEEAYRDAVRKIPQDLIQTFLIRDIKDPNLWRIISVWRSKSDYEKNIESTGLYATCVDVFRNVGVEPTRRKFDIIARHTHV
jgi:quinol monooxygenase YgiN